jgi:hypothetical protein
MEKEEDAKQLANHNIALNPKDLLTGRLGQPLQGPLNATRLKAFADAAQAEKSAQAKTGQTPAGSQTPAGR